MFGPWDWKPSSGKMILQVAQPFHAACAVGVAQAWPTRRDVADAMLTAAQVAPVGRGYVLGGANLRLPGFVAVDRSHHRRDSPPVLRPGPIIRYIGGFGGDISGMITGKEPYYEFRGRADRGPIPLF